MKLWNKTSGLACAAILTASIGVADQGAAAASPRRDVRVGSFNIVGVHADSKAGGTRKRWRERRPKVVAQILSQKLDVVGVQEANQSTIYKSHMTYGESQYLDLRGALNARRGHYALTNTRAYNCANPRSTYKCRYRNQNASGSNRILYDTDTVSLLRQGSLTYRAAAAGKPKRYLAWAMFKMKATGKKFLFTNTHLDPYSIPARKRQWDQMIAKINAIKGTLPVVAVGDFNTSKFSEYARTYLPRMRNNGYGDVVNQRYRETRLSRPRARNVRRAWVNSYGSFRRDVRSYSYDTSRRRIGNGIDWIFASNNVRVKGWEVVVDLNPATLKLRGVIPSDHALVRATLTLP